MLKYITETDLAYIAGFTDGEGTIALWMRREGRSLVPIVQVVNADIETLTWVKYTFDGYGSISKHVYEIEGWKNTWTYSIRAIKEVTEVLELLIPYLRSKSKHAELLLIYCKEHKYGSGSPTVVEMSIYEDLKELNRRGK